MKKIFSAAIFALTAVMICGCAKKTEKADNNNTAESTSVQTETTTTKVLDRVPVTEPEATTVRKTPASTISSAYIKDNAGIMSNEDIQLCDQLISELSSSRMLNAAVVTTNDLGGAEPYNYAAKCYNEIFTADKNNGILFLINNDTNEDILYKSGIMTIDPDAEKEALFKATQEIVAGNYGAAASGMLRLGEACPSHIFDNSGFFTPQQITDIEKAASEYGTELSVCTVGSLIDVDNTASNIFYQRRYPEKNGILLLIDGSGATAAYSDMNIPQNLKSAAPASPVSNTDDLYNYLIALLIETRD